MIKRMIIIIPSLLLLAACSFGANNSGYPNPSYPDPSYPNSSPMDQYVPRMEDANFTRKEAYLDSAELITMESSPLQFSIKLKGHLPTSCYQIRIAPHPADETNTINVDVYTVVDPKSFCPQTTKSYEVNFPLGSYPSGHYILFVNGKKISEFDA